jgi:hypothetical protein
VGRETKSRTDEVLFLDEEDEINIPYIWEFEHATSEWNTLKTEKWHLIGRRLKRNEREQEDSFRFVMSKIKWRLIGLCENLDVAFRERTRIGYSWQLNK